MAQRLVGWRKKPPAKMQPILEAVCMTRLYLVHQKGPTIFVLRDDEDESHKVQIGVALKCSCDPDRNDHCLHTLYVVNKIYKVPIDHPLVWQASYTDSDIDNMVQMKFKKIQKKVSRPPRPKRWEDPAREDEPRGKEVAEDSCCPICQDGMVTQATTFCRCCGNHFHIHCLKVWLRHKTSSGDTVNCPMCRKGLQKAWSYMEQDQAWFEAKFITHAGVKCAGCSAVNLKGRIFKCVHCAGVVLCESCMYSQKHSQHSTYLTKRTAAQQWQQVTRFRDDRQYKAQPQLSTHQFLVRTCPTLHQLNQNNISTLCITGTVKKKPCSKCQTVKGAQQLRVAACGHFFCQSCLVHIFTLGFKCPEDDSTLAKGFLQAMKIKLPQGERGLSTGVKKTVRTHSLPKQNQPKGLKLPMIGDELGIGLGIGIGINALKVTGLRGRAL